MGFSMERTDIGSGDTAFADARAAEDCGRFFLKAFTPLQTLLSPYRSAYMPLRSGM
jgi:hypothetical protein